MVNDAIMRLGLTVVADADKQDIPRIIRHFLPIAALLDLCNGLLCAVSVFQFDDNSR